MFFRLLLESFLRQRRRKLLAGIAILLGTTAVTAMLALATTIGDRIHQELAVYGANIIVTPKAANLDVKIGDSDIHPTTGNAYLHESDLAKLKTIFWANNITGINPELSVNLPNVSSRWYNDAGGPGHLENIPAVGLWFNHSFGNADGNTGANTMHPSWKLSGKWPANKDEVVLGSALAHQLHQVVGYPIVYDRPTGGEGSSVVSGIVDTGSNEDNEVLFPLDVAQSLADLPDKISRVEISARTKPEDAFARKDPDTLSPAQHEIWYCRPYANSIAYQIREAIPGADAEQIRKTEQSEGTILNRISGLMWLISAAALLAAGFAVSAAMATAILERRAEIGLMRSLGAAKSSIALLFYSETALLALIAGTLGYLLGSILAAWLGARIFPSETVAAATHLAAIFIPVLLPVTVGLALIVAIAGSTPSIRTALRLDPANILRADA